MIIENKSLNLINQQKARAKMFEFDVGKDDYPSFNANIDDLILPTHFTLFKYCFNLFNGNRNDELKTDLAHSYEYFESSCRDGNISTLEQELRFLGAISSFALNNFAASKILFSGINVDADETPTKGLLLKFLRYVFGDYKKYIPSDKNELDSLIADYLNGNKDFDALDLEFRKLHQEFDDFDNFVYYYYFYSVLKSYEENRASRLLPYYSNTDFNKWANYFNQKSSVRMLWKSQRLVCESGLLTGRSGLISLPTGTGKTKSIEIIIQSRIINGNLSNVLIVAPLRALVNEIRTDLKKHFKNAVVNNISDANVNDYDDILSSTDLNIVVLTPEKLLYIIHHKRDFLDNFQLLVFDEAHMIMEKGRGSNYEFLLMFVKNHLSSSQQLILITAVITNSSDLKKWVFGSANEGVLVEEKNIISTSKSIGFYKPSDNWLSFYENKISRLQEDYFIPKFLTAKEKNAEDKNSLTVFVTEKVSKNGSTVIYIPRQNQLNGFLTKVVELVGSNWSNDEEVLKINAFLTDNYGPNSIYVKAASCGYYSHYGDAQNGVKLLLENSFKNGLIGKMVATSTLSEGVNLPIKNFIIVGTNYSSQPMPISKFKNLYGRAVRPDKYTNGNIVSMELAGIDSNWKKQKIMGKYKEYIDEETPAKCLSSIDIHSMIDCLLQSGISEHVLNRLFVRLGDCSTYEDLLANNSFIEFSEDAYKALYSNKELSNTIDAIENYLSLLFVDINQSISSTALQSLIEISEDTYCFECPQNVNDGNLIKALIAIVGIHFFSMEPRCKALYFTSVCNKKYYEIIFPWIDGREANLELLETICDLVRDLYYEKVIKNNYLKQNGDSGISANQFISLLDAWTNGLSIVKIQDKMREERWDADINKIEKFIRSFFDYDFPIFISNVIDSLSIIEGEVIIDGKSVKQGCIDKLTDMIESVKNGLPNYLSNCFYKNIFQDRLMSMKLYNALLSKDWNYDDLIFELKKEEVKEKVLNLFKKDPTFFYNKVEEVLND